MRCSIISAVHTSQSALFTYQCALCNVQCAVINVQCVHCNIHFALCNWAGTRHSDTGHRQFPQFAAAAFKFNFTSIRATSPLPLPTQYTPQKYTSTQVHTCLWLNFQQKELYCKEQKNPPTRRDIKVYIDSPDAGEMLWAGPNVQFSNYTLDSGWVVANTKYTKYKMKIQNYWCKTQQLLLKLCCVRAE